MVSSFEEVPARELRSAALRIDGHAQKRVDERQRVGAGRHCGARDLGHVGDVRREFHDERALRGGAAPGHDRLDACLLYTSDAADD